MKKLIVASALALTATVAVAGTQINLRKVNKVIASVIEPELTPLIKAIEIKFNERSNLTSVEKLNTAVTASATARASKWSDRPTSLDVNAAVKTVSTDVESTKLDLVVAAGSKTDAVALYSYAATAVIKDMENDEGEQTPLEKEFLTWFTAAALTKKLDSIPAQLEQLVVLMKKTLNPDDEYNVDYAKLVNSLKVDTRIHNYKTVEVILKTTEAVTISSFFGMNIEISNLAFKISEKGLSFNGQFGLTAHTQSTIEFLDSVKGSLSMIEKADAETLQGLRETARGYIELAEAFVNGKEE